jgi:hypothetical protein
VKVRSLPPSQSVVQLEIVTPEIREMPANGGFLLRLRLYTPKLDNLGARSPIVSGGYLKYSRFWETPTGDRFDLHCVADWLNCFDIPGLGFRYIQDARRRSLLNSSNR